MIRRASGWRGPILGFAFVAAFIGAVVIAWASLVEDRIEIQFMNDTDHDLCYELSLPPQDACSEVDARSTATWKPVCKQDDHSMTIMLRLRESETAIYDRTATCAEWRSAPTIAISEADSGLTVTDNLPLEF